MAEATSAHQRVLWNLEECKWTHDEDADRLMDVLEQKAKYLPFIKKGQEIHLVLFLKESPTHCAKGMRVFLPSDVMKA